MNALAPVTDHNMPMSSLANKHCILTVKAIEQCKMQLLQLKPAAITRYGKHKSMCTKTGFGVVCNGTDHTDMTLYHRQSYAVSTRNSTA